MPAIFPWLQRLGSVDDAEMDRVFNMGIGLVMVVAEYFADSIVRRLSRRAGVGAWVIGEVVEGDRAVTWEG
jgi:phosphoribosylformylglycinamidine cyclo-ligase